MNRREFFIHTAVSGLIAAYPAISISDNGLLVRPSGEDDTVAINSALKESARLGIPAKLGNGVFTITNTIVVPAGARLIANGKSSKVRLNSTSVHEVIRIDEPHVDHPVEKLFVENKSSRVPFKVIIG